MKNLYLYSLAFLWVPIQQNLQRFSSNNNLPINKAAGIYSKPINKTSDPSATIINAKSYGFLPSASAAKNTIALQQISNKINSLKGGVTLVINKGVYRVGNETPAGASGKGYAFAGATMLKIVDCNKPVIIEGNGATLKFADGLHFGSFETKTGAIHKAAPGGFYNYDYTAYPQIMIELTRNKSVTVKNMTLDGNLQNFLIGGYWGDTGIQLPADGIISTDNEELIIEKTISRYFPRDGIVVANKTPDTTTAIKKVFLLNSVFDGNARQGLSWVGGNHLYALNCSFINTGKAINKYTKAAFASAPCAGVDMEAELGIIRNGVYKNCIIDNNTGAGFLTVGDVASITYDGGKIIGATMWSIYGSGAKTIFQKTTIVGSPVNLRTGTGPNDKDNTQFNNCLITLDSTLSPTKKVYGRYVMDFGGGAGGFFNNCIIDSKDRGTVYGGLGCVFTNCIFRQGPTTPGYNGYTFFSGNFYGTNRWEKFPYEYKYKLAELAGLIDSKFYGPFFVNGAEVTGKRIN